MWMLALLLLLFPALATAEVYQCPNGKGGKVLRDVPCNGAHEEAVPLVLQGADRTLHPPRGCRVPPGEGVQLGF